MDLEHYEFSPDDAPQQWRGELPARSPIDSERTLVVLFHSPALTDLPALLTRVQRAFPRACLVGCSASGQIHERRCHRRSLSIAAVRFRHTSLRLTQTRLQGPESSFYAGAALAANLAAAPDLQGALIFTDSRRCDLDLLRAGLHSRLPRSLPLPLFAACPQAGPSSILSRGALEAQQVCAVGLHGIDLQIRSARDSDLPEPVRGDDDPITRVRAVAGRCTRGLTRPALVLAAAPLERRPAGSRSAEAQVIRSGFPGHSVLIGAFSGAAPELRVTALYEPA